MFADLEGSMDLIEDLDPEEARDIVDPALKLMIDAVQHYDGYVTRSTGEGIFALFGAPVAHEDHPQRALFAALRMREDLKRYSDKLREQGKPPISIRVGVNIGEVVIPTIKTAATHTEYVPIGHSVSLAARLQARASPGSIAISGAVRKLVEGYFTLNALGPAHIKGVSEPVEVYEVTGLGPLRNHFDLSRVRGLSRFVGRVADLRTLKDALEQTAAGNGQVVGVVAEAGAGKSRLCFEFLKHCRARGTRVYEGRAVAHGRNIPFLPILELFRAYFGITLEDDERSVREKIAGRILLLDQSFAAALPLLFDFLGVSDPQRPAPRLEPEARQRQLIGVMRRVIQSVSETQPTVTLVEDLHWLDAASAEFLEQMVDARAESRNLLLVNFRPEYRAEWMQKSWYRQIPLTPLGREAIAELLADLLGKDASLAGLAGPIHARTGGNPFFTEEVAQSLIESGHLQGTRGAYRLVTPIDKLEIPATVQAVVAARIDRLADRDKRLLQVASVIGKDFPEPLLAAVAQLPADELKAALATLRRAEFVHEQTLYPVAEYAFKHPLTQEVTLGSLLLQQRKELHRAVGRGIEELYPDRLNEHYAELAHNFISAEDWSKALEYSRLAGDQAAQSYSNVEAEQHYARALAAASKLPPVEPGALVDLYIKRGEVLNIVGRHNDAVADYQRAQEIARSARDRQREVQVLFHLSCVYWDTHQKDPTLEYSRQALTLARETGDKFLEGMCLIWTLVTGNTLGPNSGSREEAEQAVSLVETTGSPLRAFAHFALGSLLQWQADFDRSIPHLNQVIELAGPHEGRLYGISLLQLGSAYLSKGEYQEALRCYGRLAEYADGAGDKFLMAVVANLPGGAHLELYDFDEALKNSLESYETACQMSQWTEPRGHTLTKAGLAYLELGNFVLADKFFLRACELFEEKDEFARWRWEMVLLRGRGELALARGQHDEAWKFATESLDLASKTVSRKHVARAQWLQGEILAASGRLDEAARTLDASAMLAEQIGTPREIWIARSALGRVLGKLGRDNEVEAQFVKAADAIEVVSSKLKTRALSRSLLCSETVRAVYQALGRQPPLPIA
jgi:class 3 adenylate cyclase/tetratricopeptide (TPR) repeat protein